MAAAVEEKANHQVLFREVNEHIAELEGDWSETGVSLFVCECSNPDCAESLEIRPEEYERVRGQSARFVVAAGHQLLEVERVWKATTASWSLRRSAPRPRSHAPRTPPA